MRAPLDRHAIGPGVLAHLPAPRSVNGLLRRMALRWRFRAFVALLVLALLPAALLAGAVATLASVVLLAAVFVWDAYARRCREWTRYARERQLLEELLAKEPVEAFYEDARDEVTFGESDHERDVFGERRVSDVDPIHYLRHLWIQRELERFGPGAGSHILDLGCQQGLITRLFDHPGDSLVAADLNPAALEVTRRRHPQWALVRANARALPFRADHFDLVNFSEVLEHLSSPAAALAEIRRCLRRKGTLFLTTNNRHGLTWSEWLNPLCVAGKVLGLGFPELLPPPALVWEDRTVQLAFYHTDFDRREIETLVRGAGLDIVARRSYAHVGELHRILARLFPRWSERRAASLLHAVDRVCNAIPVLRSLGLHWLVVARRRA